MTQPERAPSLQPGQTSGFSLRVPRELLQIDEPGAYWIGVHAIGDSSVPRDAFADGVLRPKWFDGSDDEPMLFGVSVAETRAFALKALERRMKVIGLVAAA